MYWIQRSLDCKHFLIDSLDFQFCKAVTDKIKNQFKKVATQFTLEITNNKNGKSMRVVSDYFGFDKAKKTYVYTEVKYTGKEEFFIDDAWSVNQKILDGWLKAGDDITIRVKASDIKITDAGLEDTLQYDSIIALKDFEIQAIISEPNMPNAVREVQQIWPK